MNTFLNESILHISMLHYLFSSREGAAVIPTARRRPEVEGATRLRLWCRASYRGWVSTAGPSALVSRWRLYYRRWRCKCTSHICAHLTAAPVGKATLSWIYCNTSIIFKVMYGGLCCHHNTDSVLLTWLCFYTSLVTLHYSKSKIKSRTTTHFHISIS